MFNVLVVEDDKKLRQLYCAVLSKNGYQAIPAEDGEEALKQLDKAYIDLIITDIMMPVLDGYELIHLLRKTNSNIPVLMITAKQGYHDMQQGFAAGTDDYMVKPIDVNEMVLRVGALLRRSQIMNERKLKIGGTVLEYDTLTLHMGDSTLLLPQKEFYLLYKLVSYPNKIFTRAHLMDEIWGMDSSSDARTVDVHINRIRDRLRDNPDLEIITVRGLGYKAVKKT